MFFWFENISVNYSYFDGSLWNIHSNSTVRIGLTLWKVYNIGRKVYIGRYMIGFMYSFCYNVIYNISLYNKCVNVFSVGSICTNTVILITLPPLSSPYLLQITWTVFIFSLKVLSPCKNHAPHSCSFQTWTMSCTLTLQFLIKKTISILYLLFKFLCFLHFWEMPNNF